MSVPNLDDWPALKRVYTQFMADGIMETDKLNALVEEMMRDATTTLGASDAIIKQRLTDLLGKSIAEGGLAKDFVNAADPLLENPSYWSLVYDMTVKRAFSNGHISEAFFGPFADSYVAWQFVGQEPAEEPDCPGGICSEMYELAFDKDDPEARRRMPPMIHFGCRHRVRYLTQEEADGIGITDAAEMPEPAEGFGEDKIDALPDALKAA